MILSFPMTVIIVLFTRGVSRGHPISSLWQILAAGLIMGFFMFLLSWMEITVIDDRIEIVLGPGLYRKKLDIRNIQELTVTRIPWYATGIKKIRNGWLVGVDSSPGIRIDFKDGKCLVLGTEDVERLMAVLEERMGSLA